MKFPAFSQGVRTIPEKRKQRSNWLRIIHVLIFTLELRISTVPLSFLRNPRQFLRNPKKVYGFEVVHPSDVCMLLQFTKAIYFYQPYPTAGVRTSHYLNPLTLWFQHVSTASPYFPSWPSRSSRAPARLAHRSPVHRRWNVPAPPLFLAAAWARSVRGAPDATRGYRVWFRKLGMSWNLWGFHGLPFRTFLVI